LFTAGDAPAEVAVWATAIDAAVAMNVLRDVLMRITPV
jgi:hypothetical protein